MDSPSDAQLARVVVRSLAAVIALVLAGGVASAAGRLGEDADEDASDVVVGRSSLSPRGGLGPLPGTSVPSYLRAAEAARPSIEGRRAAVVSFAGYRTVAQATDVLEGTDVVRWLVALPGGRPEELEADRDLAAWIAGQRDEAAAEKKALEELLPTVEDPDFQRQYRADIDQLAALLDAGTDRRDVVFGAVVVGPARTLLALADRPDVRVVDADGDATPPPVGATVGLRPEETIEAGDPPARPAD